MDHMAGRGKGSWTEQSSNRRLPESRLTESQVTIHKKGNCFLLLQLTPYIKLKLQFGYLSVPFLRAVGVIVQILAGE